MRAGRSLIVVVRAPADRPARAGRRRSAAVALAAALLVLVGATAGFSVAVETVAPEWRDPEFGHRVRQVTGWKARAPHRPLALLVGTSRVQMGLSPAAMGLPDTPGTPLVYNCGYRGATPVWCCLQAERWLDSDAKPAAVVLSLSNWEMVTADPADKLYADWANRLDRRDLDRLAPYCDDPAALTRLWRQARLNPWAGQREAVTCEHLPDWHATVAARRCAFATSWRVMDEYGFAPWPLPVEHEDRQRFLAGNRAVVTPLMSGKVPVGGPSDRAVRSLIARCQREGVAVACLCPPESPTYRYWYAPEGRAMFDRYWATLSRDTGVPLFPAPDGLLGECDFADGYHLTGRGAETYSRWLADNHLKPWFAAHFPTGGVR